MLFEAAAAVPDPERAAFLDRECAGDLALRVRLDVLLAAHEQSDGVLASRAQASRPPRPRCGHDDRPLQAFGEARRRRLWRGLCGRADRAGPAPSRPQDDQAGHGDTKQVVARFEAERQALAMMDHPNIAKVLDAGTTEAGKSEIRNHKSEIPTEWRSRA
jgi:hypothetical protein